MWEVARAALVAPDSPSSLSPPCARSASRGRARARRDRGQSQAARAARYLLYLYCRSAALQYSSIDLWATAAAPPAVAVARQPGLPPTQGRDGGLRGLLAALLLPRRLLPRRRLLCRWLHSAGGVTLCVSKMAFKTQGGRRRRRRRRQHIGWWALESLCCTCSTAIGEVSSSSLDMLRWCVAVWFRPSPAPVAPSLARLP